MSQGLAYDSDAGRGWAAAITSIMTGHCYATSAKIAKRVGVFEEYELNKDPMLRVMSKHRDAAYEIPESDVPGDMWTAARSSWDEALTLGLEHGYRNAQATVLAPTGCLVGGTLVPTERGLVRLGSLGDVDGHQWQDLNIEVNTDEGPRTGDTVLRQRFRGSCERRDQARLQRSRARPSTGSRSSRKMESWQWKRFAELNEGDMVPMSLNQLIGEPQKVALPPLSEAYWTGEHHAVAPRRRSESKKSPG